MLNGSQQLCLGLMVLSAQFFRKRGCFTYTHRSEGRTLCWVSVFKILAVTLFYFTQSSRQAYSSWEVQCQCHESDAKLTLISWPRVVSFQLCSNKKIRKLLLLSELQLSTQFSISSSTSCPSAVPFPVTVIITAFHQAEKNSVWLQNKLETCFTQLSRQPKSTQDFLSCCTCFMDRAIGDFG